MGDGLLLETPPKSPKNSHAVPLGSYPSPLSDLDPGRAGPSKTTLSSTLCAVSQDHERGGLGSGLMGTGRTEPLQGSVFVLSGPGAG